jgi:hypothetical protein
MAVKCMYEHARHENVWWGPYGRPRLSGQSEWVVISVVETSTPNFGGEVEHKKNPGRIFYNEFCMGQNIKTSTNHNTLCDALLNSVQSMPEWGRLNSTRRRE